MQISSGTKNNSSPIEPSCTTISISFSGAFLVVTGTWRSHIKVRRESDCKLNLESSENITHDHCCGVQNACSQLQEKIVSTLGSEKVLQPSSEELTFEPNSRTIVWASTKRGVSWESEKVLLPTAVIYFNGSLGKLKL
ncbi:uncharacterized protein TNCV_4148181 [Trichonephila clavipes]|nr:uncharacterized protein TNCV_4148181 [Trichonephila clavipes]